MSMIPCPECGHSVSSRAETCPECGVSIAGNVKRCPVCNEYLLMAAEECPHCHTRFVVPADKAVASQTPPPLPEEKSEASAPVKAQPDKPDATAGNGKSRAGWYMLAVLLILAAVAGLLFWSNYSDEEASQEAEFQMLMTCNDLQSFQTFENRYPTSTHIQEVRARISELKKEEMEWQKAVGSHNADAISKFMKTYPQSVRRQAALRSLDTLEWHAAEGIGTSAAYNEYIAKHESGEFITEAYSARDTALKREMRARYDSIRASRADSLSKAIAATN